jgi:hypothetical protein
MGQGAVTTSGDEPEPDGRDDLAAAALGLLALAVAVAPMALFALGPDDGRRGAWGLDEARNWTALRWYATASLVGLAPALGLARLALDRARRWPAKVPAALAVAATIGLVPGAMIRIAWWTS